MILFKSILSKLFEIHKLASTELNELYIDLNFSVTNNHKNRLLKNKINFGIDFLFFL